MSKYFKCMGCGYVFDEDDMGSYGEWVGEGVMRGQIYYGCCPECGCDDIEDANDCMECTEYFGESELNVFKTEVQYGKRDNFEYVRLCDKCLEKVKKDIAAGKDEYGIGWELEEKEELDNG